MIGTKTTKPVSPDSLTVRLGRTLPSLLNEASLQVPNPHAFNQWTESGWQSLSNQAFQTAVESLAVGLLELGLQKGDRVALLMHSDVNFCVADLGCLLANLVDVPIDLTQTLEHIIFVLDHSEARVLIVSNLDLLQQILPYLWNMPQLRYIIVVSVPEDWQAVRSQWITSASTPGSQFPTKEIPESACLDIPMLLHPASLEQSHPTVPQCLQVFSLEEIQHNGQASTINPRSLHDAIAAHDLATIVYIPDEQGQLQGVMLTHENISANALTSFSVIPNLKRGAQEVVLSFLPLNHVLARTLLYGHINYGHSIYFSSPNRVMKQLQEVHPTVLTTVPLFLEKIYSKILEHSHKASSIVERLLLRWAMRLAKRYEMEHQPSGVYAGLLTLADWLVFAKWRSVFGGRLQHLICGGAALRAEVATVFAAAGIPVMQGYGLTQASAVVCCNRGSHNRPGTVGTPIPGVELTIAEDGEILIRGPYITPGYYRNSEATRSLIDSQGWLHTGDLGTISEDGFLKIVGLKKSLFKLSTGKYIAPQPIEQRLMQSPFVDRTIVIGADQKTCALLIIPNLAALHRYALEFGIDSPNDALLKHPCVLALYQALVNVANCHLPYWAIVKQFRLIHPDIISNAEQNSIEPLSRTALLQLLTDEVKALFAEITPQVRPQNIKVLTSPDADKWNINEQAGSEVIDLLCSYLPDATCPVFAQSLNPRLTTLRLIVPFMLYTGMNIPEFSRGIAEQLITIL
ncbi:AMP-dependent synthetase/ligase [Thermocoleostomius sinensis]|uniref:AMP-binding protein n=1 Tax=Thermocoleostomius sinensis A174 TaxID=2016057 RepID=A0A9E8ZCX0_9CYAN|nr:AMP-binding protein [Thermocoleostomius sinensis]WAL59093.1 AMP-binding protein [Thermocoleostomius sinensis A174]